MLQSLKKEVEAGEVMVNQLADRLSVKILDKILFPSGEAAISAKGQNVLKRVGKVLASARDKDKIIRIEGHTDNVPIGKSLKDKFASNWELSTARATNVVRFLIESAKIPANAFEAAGLGEYHPVAKNDTPKAASRTGASRSFFIRACKSWRRNCRRRKNLPLLISSLRRKLRKARWFYWSWPAILQK